MPKHSAGILLFRRSHGLVEIFLVHPGGPFWAKKDKHAWSMPKGEIGEDEDPEAAARREFMEETGHLINGRLMTLTPFRASNKIIHAFTIKRDIDPEDIRSNHFEMEWPPGSGVTNSFPEVDKAAWFDLETARVKLHKGQMVLVEMIKELLLIRDPA